MDPATARDHLADARVARLASVRPDGRPHLVPITLAVRDDTLVTAIDHKPKSTRDVQRLANVTANPAVSVLADHYDDDWDRLWWARADGNARIIEAGPRFDEAVELLTERYHQYREHPPEGPAIVVAVDTWRGWSAT